MQTKICKMCNKEKNISEFNKDNSKKDGFSIYCRECLKQKYKNKYKIKQREYYIKNRERILKYGKEWRFKNSEYNQSHYYSSDYYIINHLSILIVGRINDAKKNNLPYDSKEDLYNCLKPIYDKRKCECCEKELVINKNKTRGPKDNSYSVDRVVPEKGYVVGNVAILCSKCNSIKSNANFFDLIKIFIWYFKKINFNFVNDKDKESDNL